MIAITFVGLKSESSNEWQWQVSFWLVLFFFKCITKQCEKWEIFKIGKKVLNNARCSMWSWQPAMEESCSGHQLQLNADTSIICVSPYDRIYLMCTCCIEPTSYFTSYTGSSNRYYDRNIHQAYRISCHWCASICRSKGILNVCSCQLSAHLMKKKKIQQQDNHVFFDLKIPSFTSWC